MTLIKSISGIRGIFGKTLTTDTVSKFIRSFLNIQPESSLKGTILKFEDRFHIIEKELANRNINLSDASLEEMDEIWNKSKKK